jgi:chlorite dismutase
MPSQEIPRSHPPETLEGWYALHQLFTVDRAEVSRARDSRGVDATTRVEATRESPPGDGWTAWAKVIGSAADVMAVHFAPTLDALAQVQDTVRRLPAMASLRLAYSFLSVTEAGLYHLTSELAREAAERGGTVGDEAYTAELTRRVARERENSHVQRRLYPPLPEDMPFICFYPMSKRRAPEQNWYSLSLAERSRLMQAHGKTGRRYAGRVVQIITGAIGFDAWEWGVTLFAKDPLDFKKLVSEMRFDEVSAKYADFGEFYVGRVVPGGDPTALFETLGVQPA